MILMHAVWLLVATTQLRGERREESRIFIQEIMDHDVDRGKSKVTEAYNETPMTKKVFRI